MRLTLTGRHIDITDGLRRVADKKAARIDRVLNTRAVACQIELYMEKFRHVAEIHVHARAGHMLQGRAVATSWSEALGAATDRITQQAKTLKGKWETRKRDAGPTRRRVPAVSAGPVSLVTAKRIVRAKRYTVKPMSVDEAAAVVGPTADAFVVFRNP